MNVINISYPPEYKDIEPNTALLERLASETSGRYAPPASDVFGGHFRPSKAYIDLWRFLALLSILLLPIDIAVRRLSMSAEQVVELYDAARDLVRGRLAARRTRRKAAAQRTETMETLLKVKKPGRERPEPAFKIDAAPPAQPPTPEPEKQPTAAPSAESPKPPEQSQPEGETASRLLEAKRRAKEKNE